MKHSIFSFLLLFLFSSPAWSLFDDEPEPLKPDEAFKLKAYAVSPNIIRAEWKIANEYYLYKEKFKFTTKSKGVGIGEPVFPKGKIKEDEFFGKVETFRNKVRIDIPITRTPNASQTLVLDTVSQGCADMGLCYPPTKETVSFALIPEDDNSVGNVSGLMPANTSIISKLNSNLGLPQSEDDVLPAEKAFIFSANVVDGNTIVASWEIADNTFLYQDKFKFSLENSDGIELQKPILPKGGVPTVDDLFGDVIVYYKKVDVKIPFIRTGSDEVDVVLKASFQGCADKGFCYPPESRTMPLLIPAADKSDVLSTSSSVSSPVEGLKNSTVAPTIEPAKIPVSEQDGIANTLASSSVFMIILTFFGFGLLLAFTPCVLPMVPILSSIIVGQGENISSKKALTMSIVYVLAMALTYTIAGVIAGLFGANLQAAFQTPWVLIIFSIVFVLLSLSMFGFYELQLPASWQSKLTQISNSQKGGTLAGVAVMGFLSALIVGPCVAAPLMGALIYIGQTGDAVLGGLALFSLSMGMGAPLIAIGASAGKLLPKAGAWMESVKAVFGVMLLAVAVWMLERILPPAVALLLWSILLIISGVFLGAFTQLEVSASGWKKLWKGFGLVFVIYGGLLLVGVASNSKDPLQPLRGLYSGGAVSSSGIQQKIEFKKIKSVEDLDRELKLAMEQGKPVMLDFYADWCVSCKEMERYTFSDGKVKAEMSKAILLKADVTANDEIDKVLLKRFKLIGPPSMIFWDRKGNELPHMRMVGFLDADKFLVHIKQSFK